MSSFLTNCPQCSTMIAKSSNCPNCHYSPEGGEAELSPELLANFARQKIRQRRNSNVSMQLRLVTGLMGFVTAICWFMFCFMGSLTALVGIMILTPMSGLLGFMTVQFDKKNTTKLFCPSCESRVDGMLGELVNCPGCHARLVVEEAASGPQQSERELVSQ